MGFSFRPGLHACDVDRNLVFLDVPSDRYFALSIETSAACLRLIAGELAAPGDDALVDGLVRRKIVCQSEGSTLPTLCPPVPDILSIDGVNDGGAIRVSEAVFAITRELSAMVELKLRPFEHILWDVARRKKRSCSVSFFGISPERATRTFAAVDRIISSHRRCLPRSVALAHALISGGSVPILVLGVKLRPFEAHCWVQVDNRLIGEDPGRVAPFTPILII